MNNWRPKVALAKKNAEVYLFRSSNLPKKTVMSTTFRPRLHDTVGNLRLGRWFQLRDHSLTFLQLFIWNFLRIESKIGGLWLGSPGWTSKGQNARCRTPVLWPLLSQEIHLHQKVMEVKHHHPRFTVKVETLNSKFDMEFSFQARKAGARNAGQIFQTGWFIVSWP